MTDDASSPVIALDGAPPPASAEAADGSASGADTKEAPEPVYTAVEDWVTGYFLPMFRRTLGGEFRWCAQWWRHSEAISRLGALWHAWEVLRLQPGTGIATWYRDHLDHQLPILMGTRGPFYQCSEAAHREPREAAVMPAPDGWWDTDEPADAGPPGGGPATGSVLDGLAFAPDDGLSLPPGDHAEGGGNDA